MILKLLIATILFPLLAGLLVLVVPKQLKWVKEVLTILVTGFGLCTAIALFNKTLMFSIPWAGFGIDFSLRLYNFSGFILLATAGFGFLIALYCTSFLKDKDYAKQFYLYYLISLAFTNGAILADNLILLLFFWEGLLGSIFGLILIGGKDAYKTAIKTFIIVGVTDLCMMIGMGITGHLAGTFTISQISLPLTPLASLAFTLLMIGAISKAGSMPFHSWIPDAAIDAPLPFMAFLPAALEKLLGIYFLARISFDLFQLTPQSWISPMLMIIGSLTILFAVMMALIQKDYKRLLSYHAISQVGYMILGIGTMVPAGMVGGLFHMINHALYKSCLFLTGGSVEKQTGSTNLEKLGGLGAKMPITFICFLVAAASISGVPPFNGFFSKELIYDGAMERGTIFYIAAVLGSFLTAASFLKLGHAAFLGPKNIENKKVKESPLPMLIPMITIAFICILFGVWNALPLNHLIQPVIGLERLEGHNFAGFHVSGFLFTMTLIVLGLALLNHLWGVKRTGSGLKAADHIHYAPGLHYMYDKAEKRVFDPYNIGLAIVTIVAHLAFGIDRAIDWIYGTLIVKTVSLFTGIVKMLQDGNYVTYIVWSLTGTGIILFLVLR
ncbi:MAG: proton-conducting transporter membrane subunit [Candidatus Saganbacteria bacterium]|nr:proton-conducting transporter membrane subunit [Candidatus Saganbacteria bacterium]